MKGRGRRCGLVAVVFLLASFFCVALSQVPFRFCVSVLLIAIGWWFVVEVFFFFVNLWMEFNRARRMDRLRIWDGVAR